MSVVNVAPIWPPGSADPGELRPVLCNEHAAPMDVCVQADAIVARHTARGSTAEVIPSLAAADDLVLLPDGEYTGFYVRHHVRMIFSRPKLVVMFQLVEHPGLMLPRWYRVQDYRGGRIRAGAHSDIVRELTAVLGQRVRRDRLPITSLARIPCRLLVRTVTQDHRQQKLPELCRYSVVSRVLGRA